MKKNILTIIVMAVSIVNLVLGILLYLPQIRQLLWLIKWHR